MTLEHSGVKARVEDDLGELRGSLAGTVVEPTDPEYDSARRSLQRTRRSSAGGDRALRRSRRHRSRSRLRADSRARGRSARRRPQPRRTLRLRRRPGDRSLQHARRRRRSGGTASLAAQGGATWLDFDTSGTGVRPGHARRHRRLDRRDGARTRRRHRPPDGPARPHLRQHRGCRARDSRRHRRPGATRRECGAPLGASRRWRQLRRRNTSRAPPASARTGRRWPARISRRRSRRRPSHLPRRRSRLASGSQHPSRARCGRVARPPRSSSRRATRAPSPTRNHCAGCAPRPGS